MNKLFFAGAAALALGACASVPPPQPYAASADTTAALTSTVPAGVTLGLGDFTSTEVVDNNPKCRLAGRINPAGTLTIPDYVRSAMTSELKAAGLYDAESAAKISGKVFQSDLVSSGNASWTVGLTLSNGETSYDTVTTSYFEPRFEAGAACATAEGAFREAVSKLVKDAVSDARFVELVPAAAVEVVEETVVETVEEVVEAAVEAAVAETAETTEAVVEAATETSTDMVEEAVEAAVEAAVAETAETAEAVVEAATETSTDMVEEAVEAAEETVEAAVE